MPKIRISTGIKELDADLQVLAEAVSADRLPEIKAAIANPDLSEDELFSVVPQGLFRLIVLLREPVAYHSLLSRTPKEAKQQLDKARETVERHFSDILKHPSLTRFFSAPGLQREEISPLVGALNIINAVNHYSGWIGSPPKLQPSTRLALFGVDDQVLLFSTCDWDDLLFLVASIADILVCEMEQGRPLAELQMVELLDRDKMVSRLQEIEKSLEKIKLLGRLYGLKVDESEESDSPAVTN
jgi:hypothetical protein